MKRCSSQIGELNVGCNKFGLGFEITTGYGQAEIGVSEGSFSWGGYYSTTYWADPGERLVGMIFMQQDPLSHGEIQDKFKAITYQALDDSIVIDPLTGNLIKSYCMFLLSLIP